METTKKTGVRDFFLYLFATGMLYFSVVSVITLLWQYVNHYFPDPAAYYYYGGGLSEGMRFAVSALIIVFPIYVFLMRFLSHDLDRHPEKQDLLIRKIMVYLTLFLAAVTMVVDLVMLVNNFLGGDLTARFALKALSVLLVAGLVFWYYLFNLKRQPGTKQGARRAFLWGTLAFVLVIVVGAFILVGSPSANRDLRLDSQRVGDLQNIQWQIINYWQQKEKLPVSFADLRDDISGMIVPVDPITGAAYEYSVKGPLTFELCATFVRESIATTGVNKPIPVDSFVETPDNWQHGVGQTCFARTIDPDRYPPYTKQ